MRLAWLRDRAHYTDPLHIAISSRAIANGDRPTQYREEEEKKKKISTNLLFFCILISYKL